MNELNSGLSLYIPRYSTRLGQSLTEGFQVAPLSTAAADSNIIIPFGPYSGFSFTVLGAGAENAVVDYVIWGVQTAPNIDPSVPPKTVCLHKFGSGSATLGTSSPTGQFFSNLPNFVADFSTTSKFADTMTLTLSPWGQSIVDTYQLVAPTPHSPADNTVAWVTIPFLGRVCRGFIIELDNNNRTNEKMNALISLCS